VTASPSAEALAVPLASIRAARDLLAGIALRTPMVEVAGRPLFLKCEHLQPIGAFKLRGAHTAIARLDAVVRQGGVITNSSGNHGQAVAFAARHFGIRSVIVMPESAPAVKVAGVKRHGGEVVFAGKTRSPEQQRVADRVAAADHLTMIPPYDHPDVIAGQGTVGLEVLEQVPTVARVLVPVGGGGLLSGITAAILALRPEVEIIGVEPAGAAKLSAALANDRPTTLEQTASVADGLLTRAIGTLPWSVIHHRVLRAITVSESEIGLAVRWLFQHQGLRVEPSGAVAAAAVLSGQLPSDVPTVAILSGGNIDFEVFERLVSG